jgi:hypothetical protein
VGLFGNKDEKAAEEAAGAAEVASLEALSTDELAVELMPAFGPDGASRPRPPRGLRAERRGAEGKIVVGV